MPVFSPTDRSAAEKRVERIERDPILSLEEIDRMKELAKLMSEAPRGERG